MSSYEDGTTYHPDDECPPVSPPQDLVIFPRASLSQLQSEDIPQNGGGTPDAGESKNDAATDYRRLTNSAPLSGGNQSRCKKPDCSYAVLIGIAMRTARSAGYGPQLPVIEIYRFIEKEFPYFRKCNTTGWKNCVRHCLSLGQFFQKVDRAPTGTATILKGNLWEVIPAKKPLLERDIESFLLEEYRRLNPTHLETELVKKVSKTTIRKDNSSSNMKGVPSLSKSMPQRAKLNRTTPHTAATQSNGHVYITPFVGEISLVTTDTFDEENPLPRSQTGSAAKNSSSDVTSTNASSVTKKRNSFARSKASSKSIFNNTEISDENDESPFINNNHPVVNRGTLASISIGAAVSHRVGTTMMTTPNFITYVVAPSPITWLMSDVCTPTLSGLTATRMTHSVLQSKKGSVKCSTTPPVVQASLSVLRRGIRSQHKGIPPELQPVLAHMHDPSLLLPTSQFHKPTSYENNRFRHTCCCGDEDGECESSEREESNSCFAEENKDGEVVEKFSKIEAPSVVNGNQEKPGMGVEFGKSLSFEKVNVYETNGSTSQLSNVLDSGVQINCGTTSYTQEKGHKEKFATATNDNAATIIGNGQVMLSSTHNITSLINDVADHTHLDGGVAHDEDDDELLLEIANEWLELTIAREEEVMSSKFEEMTSSILDDLQYTHGDVIEI